MMSHVKHNIRYALTGALLFLLLAALFACDDSTGPSFAESYTLTRPSNAAGVLTLSYSSPSCGRVLYQTSYFADWGTFCLRGSDDIDLTLQSGRRSGDFDDRGARLELNDGTRWERR